MAERRPTRRALIAVLAFALVFPTLMTWAYFVGGGGWARPLYAAGKSLQFALPVLWWLRFDRMRFGWPSWPRRPLAAGLVLGLLVAAGILGLYLAWFKQHPAFAPLVVEVRNKVAGFGLTTPARYLLFAGFLTLIHAGLEEYYWRAFVFAELKNVTRTPRAITLSSLGFMAHHVIVLAVYFPGRFWTLAMPFSVAVGVGGAAWAFLYQRGKTIVAPWLSHALVDAAIMAVGADLLFAT